jgi:hypothetical protein
MVLYIWEEPDGSLHAGQKPPPAAFSGTGKFQLWKYEVTLGNNGPIFTQEPVKQSTKARVPSTH